MKGQVPQSWKDGSLPKGMSDPKTQNDSSWKGIGVCEEQLTGSWES